MAVTEGRAETEEFVADPSQEGFGIGVVKLPTTPSGFNEFRTAVAGLPNLE